MAIKAAERMIRLASELKVRPYRPEDYRTAQKWWLQHNQAHLEEFLLSDLGFVVEKDNPVAMGWLYLSNSKLSNLGWVVVNPEAGPKLRVAALITVYRESEKMSRKMGYRAMQMLSDQPSLTKLMEVTGYKRIKSHDYMVKYLGAGEGLDDV